MPADDQTRNPNLSRRDALKLFGAGATGILSLERVESVKWTGTPMEERKHAIVNQLVSFLGPEAAHPMDYEDQDWPTDPWSRGCFSVTMGPGVMTSFGPVIRQPHERIHSAGTETATMRMGYVDGAVRSEDRAAEEMLTKLKRA